MQAVYGRLMLLPRPLQEMKRAWYESIRRNRFARRLMNVDNSLNHQIVSGLPSKANRVLVLSPHPDDDVIGCGGTLALLADKGSQIDVVFMTSGAPDKDLRTVNLREAEARKAATVLGLQSLHFLRGQDGDLHLQPWLSDSIGRIIEEKQYQTIFCPWAYDGHSDHAATFGILKNALKRTDVSSELWFFEVWAPVLANRVVDIDLTIDLKCKAIGCHESQLADAAYIEKFRALARYRSLLCLPATVGYAEAYVVWEMKGIKKNFPK